MNEDVYLPEINIFAPENGCSWKMIVSFWGPGLFSGAFAVSFRDGIPPIKNGDFPLP